MKDSGWYNKSSLPGEMVRGAKADLPGWYKLEYSEHFQILNSQLQIVNVNSVVDIGCGSAEFARVYPNIKYLGCDLEHIIEKVSKVCNPGLQYKVYDAYECEDYSFIENYDLLLMNGFLSEMIDPLKLINKIVENDIKYILIHRQDFIDNRETYTEEYITYANQPATNSYINFKDFSKIIEKKYEIVTRVHSGMSGSDKETVFIKSKKIFE